MATIKAMVKKCLKRKDGKYKVVIRLNHQGQEASIKNEWYASESDTRKNGELKGSLKHTLDIYIASLFEKYQRNAQLALRMNARQLADFLSDTNSENFALDFISYTRENADLLEKDGRISTAKLRRCAINSFARFVKSDHFDINSITKKILLDWFGWILAQPQLGNRKRGRRAPTSYKQQLQVVYKLAMYKYNDEDNNLIRIPRNPFLSVTPPKDNTPEKRALTVEQIRAIANLPYQEEIRNIHNRFNFAKDVFILSFCLIGMNTVDLFNCKEIHDGKIIYERAKTRTRRSDHARMEVAIPDMAMPLFEKYSDNKSDYVFNFHRQYSSVGTMTAAVNKGLKQIGKVLGIDRLQFYAARHSWATIAVNDVKIDKYIVHQALNHVDEKTAITDIYIKKDWRLTDEANEAVMDYVFRETPE